MIARIALLVLPLLLACDDAGDGGDAVTLAYPPDAVADVGDCPSVAAREARCDTIDDTYDDVDGRECCRSTGEEDCNAGLVPVTQPGTCWAIYCEAYCNTGCYVLVRSTGAGTSCDCAYYGYDYLGIE